MKKENIRQKIERRRNAVLTKHIGFYDSENIICVLLRFVNISWPKCLDKL